MVKRRDFIKGMLGAIGLGAAAPLLGGERKLVTTEKPDAQPEPRGAHIQLTVSGDCKAGRVEWCGEVWELPEDSGVTKVVDTVHRPEDGVDLQVLYPELEDPYTNFVIDWTTTRVTTTGMPVPKGQQITFNQVVVDSVIYTWVYYDENGHMTCPPECHGWGGAPGCIHT